LSYLGFTLSLSGALTVASLFVIARRHGRQAVSVWGYPFTPLLYVVATLVLAGIAGRRQPVELLTAVITIVSGSVVYYGFGLQKTASTVGQGLRAKGQGLERSPEHS
jgi:APA family basic amino acid/polyamine antiporter